jgi:ribulose-phosphate 3-epimerase
MPLIAPSFLSADLANLQAETEWLNASAADWYHIDVMDGQFVPNISLGLPVVRAIKKHASKPLDVHLMMLNAERYVGEFVAAGAASITVHVEACVHLDRTLNAIKELGARASVGINPSTPIEVLVDVLYACDMVCLMSVNPGFGGQVLIENTFKKIARLKQLIVQKNVNTLIEIDGGVTLNNCKALVDAGADVLVAGNTVFGAADRLAAVSLLKGCN